MKAKKYYKFVNPKGHRGLIYKEGLNVDPNPFNPSGDCTPGGIYFASEDILAFMDYGDDVYSVEPVGDIYRNPGKPIKYKAPAVYLKYIGKALDVNVIKRLLDEGANVNAGVVVPLEWAIYVNNIELIKLLISYGADVNINDGMPIKYAVRTGNTDIVDILVNAGADVHQNEQDLIHIAIESGNISMIKKLETLGMKYDPYDAIRIAVKIGNVDVFRYLFESNKHIFGHDQDIINYAEMYGLEDIVRFLKVFYND